MKKNHERASHKKGFSVALPKKLLADIEAIAGKETRSRNGQIEHFLAEAVQHWQAASAQTQTDQAAQTEFQNKQSNSQTNPRPRTKRIAS